MEIKDTLIGKGDLAGFSPFYFLLGEVASENLAIFAVNLLGIFIVQLLNKCPWEGGAFIEQMDSSVLFQENGHL